MATETTKTDTAEQKPKKAAAIKPPAAVVEVEDVQYDPETSIGWFEPTLAEAKEMNLSRSLANARAEFKPIYKSKEGQIQSRKYMYADHSDILDAIVDTLAKYEIEVAHDIVYKDIGRDMWMFINVRLIKGPDERSLEWPIGMIDEKNQTNGANLTYAKRYAISTILNLAPDEDTDGVSPDDRRDNRARDDRDRGRRDDRDSNFDQREDPHAWRKDVDDGDRRGEGSRDRDDRREDTGAVRSGKVRSGPDKDKARSDNADDRIASVAIDSLNSSGNKKSCETFWEMFKKETKLAEDNPRYIEVKELYSKRWKMHKAEEDKQKDPLGAGTKKDTAPEPNVDTSPDHVSPDMALGELETLLENCTSMVEYDSLLKKYTHLLDVAKQFPPDEDTLNGMLDATVERLQRPDDRTQRMDDVEDDDRRSENRGGGFASERF